MLLIQRLPRLTLQAFMLGSSIMLASLVFNACSQPARLSKTTRIGKPASGEEEGELHKRGAWFYAQRAYPANQIPQAAREMALRQWDVEELRLLERGVINRVAQTNWESLGPQPIEGGQTFGNNGDPRGLVSGRVADIAFDPGYNGTTNQTVYLGAAQGGVWKTTNNGQTWTPLTEDQPSLAVGAIAIDPTNSQVIYVGTGEAHFSGDSYYGAGLLKSVNGGQTWTRITGPAFNDQTPSNAFINATFSKIVINPAAPQTVYVCTAGGSTSSSSASTEAVPLGRRGVWKSTDGGQTFALLDVTGTDGQVAATDLWLDPNNRERVFAALAEAGIYRSENGGATWVRATSGLPRDNFSRIVLAAGPPLPPATQPTLYAAFALAGDNIAFFRSTDGGAVWTGLNEPETGGQHSYNLALAVDPTDANLVYYCTSANKDYDDGSVWRSRDGGQTWQGISRSNGNGGLHSDSHVIVIAPGNRSILFTGNDGGIWRTDNALANVVPWTNLNRTLSITQFQSLALHPANANLLFGGTQDNGTNSYNGGAAWSHKDDGDGGFTLIDQANPLFIYHTYYNTSRSADPNSYQLGPVFSRDGGNVWEAAGCFNCLQQPGNINPDDPVSFYAPLAQHTGFAGANGNVIYFGTNRVYRSADNGKTWTGLGASTDGFGARLSGRTPTAYVSAIAAHPVLNAGTPPGEVVWAGTSDGIIQKTVNAGALAAAEFVNLTKAPLPQRFVTDLALDTKDQQRAVVTYSGFNQTTPGTPGHVFRTTDGGTTWTDISGNLPDVPVNTIACDPNLPNTFYIGTDIGVFSTLDGGTTWTRLGTGVPNVAVFAVRYHTPSNTLFAATHGRGVFRLKLNVQQRDTTPPALTIASHTDNQTVTTPTITLRGTASDNGTGNSGIASVMVNEIRANNDTATNGGTANWSLAVTLAPGLNTFTIVAKDNSAGLNAVTQTLRINYQAPAGSADLALSQSILSTAVPGTLLSWTLNLRNDGPNEARDVVLSQLLPGTVTLNASTAPTGWSRDGLRFSKASMAAGETAAFTITVLLDPFIRDENLVAGPATVSSSSTDPNPVNNRVATVVKVFVQADLSVGILTTARNPVFDGDLVSYTIAITNAGPSAARDFTLTDILPAALNFVSCAATNSGVCGGTGNTRTVNFALLFPSTTATVTLTGRVDSTKLDGTTLVNTASVKLVDPTADPFPTNNQRSVTLNAAPAQAKLTLEGGRTAFDFGQVMAQRELVANLPSSLFTLENAGLLPLDYTLAVNRVGELVTSGKITQPDDSAVFLIRALNADGSETAINSGRLLGGKTQRFRITFAPLIPAPAGRTDNLFAVQVIPDLINSVLNITSNGGAPFNISLTGRTTNDAKLINPLAPRVAPLVVLAQASEDEFLVEFSAFDSNLDIYYATYQFLNEGNVPVGDAPGFSLEDDIRLKGVVKGQSFTVVKRFAGAASRPGVRRVRVTLYDRQGSTVATSGLIGTQNGRVVNVSAASFSVNALAAGAIVAAFGQKLSTTTVGATTTPLPTTLAGTQVFITDSRMVERAAPLFFVAPGQINYQIPLGTAAGTATITVAAADGTLSTGNLTVASVAPALFTANSNGQGVPAGVLLRVRGDGAQSYDTFATLDPVTRRYVATPIDLGGANDQVFLILFGSGWRNRSALTGVTARAVPVNSPIAIPVDLPVIFAGSQGGLVGLDQLNLRLPRTLQGRGELEVQLTVDGKPANAVRVTFR